MTLIQLQRIESNAKDGHGQLLDADMRGDKRVSCCNIPKTNHRVSRQHRVPWWPE
jgi:hypothetical protein